MKATAKTKTKATKKTVTVKKTATKTVSKAVVKKTPVTKVKAKTAVKTTVKKASVTNTKTKTVVTVKNDPVVKKTAKTVVKSEVIKNKVAVAQPVIVKMPDNQNSPAKSSTIVTMRPQNVNTTSNVARPIYRPIQVINKPLAPVQPVRQMAPVAKSDEKVEFKKGDYVVYPAHGVGEIEAVETATIGGVEIKLYAIVFEKDRMRLKVPVFKAHASGLRKLSSTNRMQDALKTLQGRAQIRRAMWSRRAQEYETKINSGDPVAIAEVLRDLKRSNDDTEQSYSERQIYQSALERLAREVAALDKITEIEAAERLENMIKGRRGRNTANIDSFNDKIEAVA